MVVGAVLGVGALTGCGAGSGAAAAASSSVDPSLGKVTTGADGVQQVTIQTGDDYVFTPNHVAVHPGEVKLTVTNVGASGPVETGTPIISPPECCVVAFGAIKLRPMVVDGQVVARPGAWISISVDHRIVDGALATEFLTALVGELEKVSA